MKRYLGIFGDYVSSRWNRLKPKEEVDLQTRIRNDVYSAIISCSQRMDLGPNELRPEHDMDWVFGGINENRAILLLAVQHRLVPRYIDDLSRKQIPIEKMRQAQTVGEFVDCVYEFVQDANKTEQARDADKKKEPEVVR